MATIPQKELRNNVGEVLVWETSAPETLEADLAKLPGGIVDLFTGWVRKMPPSQASGDVSRRQSSATAGSRADEPRPRDRSNGERALNAEDLAPIVDFVDARTAVAS